jgi:hypothetical protein
MLVATDVAARGIDVDITHVVNYQLPDEMRNLQSPFWSYWSCRKLEHLL